MRAADQCNLVQTTIHSKLVDKTGRKRKWSQLERLHHSEWRVSGRKTKTVNAQKTSQDGIEDGQDVHLKRGGRPDSKEEDTRADRRKQGATPEGARTEAEGDESQR